MKSHKGLSIQSIRNAVNPEAKDYAFPEGNQTLVDAAYLAQGLLRAPNNLWNKLDGQTDCRDEKNPPYPAGTKQLTAVFIHDRGFFT